VLVAPTAPPVRPTAEDAETVSASGQRRRLTPEERAERDRFKADSAAWRERFLLALESVTPALADPDGPRLRHPREVVFVSPADVVDEELVRVARRSCSGRQGSALVVRARRYDGSGPAGGFAHAYCAIYTEFRSATGEVYRTRGSCVRADEARRVIAALEAWLAKVEPEAAELPDTKPEGMREGMPDVGA
jgi:hypothetical protein